MSTLRFAIAGETPASNSISTLKQRIGTGSLSAVRPRLRPYPGIDEVMRVIERLSHEAHRDAVVQASAIEIMGLARTTAVAIDRLYQWFLDSIKYHLDPEYTEEVQSAARTLELRRGDCEDHVILAAGLMAAMGIASRMVVVWQEGAEDWNHIYLQYFEGNEWKTWDTGRERPVPPGSPEPDNILYRREVQLFSPPAQTTLSGPTEDVTTVIHVSNVIRVAVVGRDMSIPELTLEVSTDRLGGGISIDCPKPTIAIRSVADRKLLSYAVVPPSWWSCVRQFRMPLTGYTGGQIIFEAYKEVGLFGIGHTIEEIIADTATPEHTSLPWTLETVPVVEPDSYDFGFGEMTGAIETMTKAALIIAGIYFLLPTAKAVREPLAKKAGELARKKTRK